MPGWAKFVVGAIVVLLVGLVCAVLFNPLTAFDTRFGRGKTMVGIAEDIAAGRCDQVELSRSGSATLWSDVCGRMADLIADDGNLSVTGRGRTVTPDELGLVSSTSYGYTFDVTDRTGLVRELAITVNEDNRVLGASIDRVTISPSDEAGYPNRHRYEQNYGYTDLDDPVLMAGLGGAQTLSEALVETMLAASVSPGDCSMFHQQQGSTYLSDTVTAAAFVAFCERLEPTLTGARIDFGDVRLLASPDADDTAFAAVDLEVSAGETTAADRVLLRFFIGHEFENGQWRLRSVFAEEDRLFYATDG